MTHTIISTCGSRYRGLVNYCLLAGDVWRLNRLQWAMQTSLLKTLACKYNSTVCKMAARYTTTIDTPQGKRTCMQAAVERTGNRKPLTARFGGIPLTRRKKAVLNDRLPPPATTCRKGKELIRRLRAGRCEWCEQRADAQAHHVRRLADRDKPGGPRQPEWAKIMAKRRRKTLVVCADCHDKIHTGQCAGRLTPQSLESYVR